MSYKKKILLIEDNELVREGFELILSSEGYEVTEVESAIAAMELLGLGGFKPDLILCDVMMPEMSGYQFLEELQGEMRQLDLVPFIFLTAKAERDDIRRGMNLGAVDYLTKPCTRKDLLYAVAARLEIAEKVEQLIKERESQVRASMLQGIPESAGDLLNNIIDVFHQVSEKNTQTNQALNTLIEGLEALQKNNSPEEPLIEAILEGVRQIRMRVQLIEAEQEKGLRSAAKIYGLLWSWTRALGG